MADGRQASAPVSKRTKDEEEIPIFAFPDPEVVLCLMSGATATDLESLERGWRGELCAELLQIGELTR